MRRYLPYILLAAALLLGGCLTAAAGNDRQPRRARRDTVSYPDTYLDTVSINRIFQLNDYMMIGFEAGAGFNRMLFNPPYSQSWRFTPEYYELTFTRYGKMFGYMPYFGLKVGVSYGHEGYRMEMNEETGYISRISGATECVYDVAEIQTLAHFHYDVGHFKLMADAGPYGGKRLRIERIGDSVEEDIRYSFLDSDKRFDYGLKGGAGFALVFDPVEFHVNAKVRYSWSNLFEPDYRSPYYYSFAYPLDVMVTAGLHFQISRKTGKTKAMLRKEAKRIVYGEDNQ
ncbi:MAG: outer membrane beta-barrel protein [Bacteroidales bacterium]|nr:outer membrane beta-barrel protein [Bacteroidales bacterium]